jgi:hypothetical protein
MRPSSARFSFFVLVVLVAAACGDQDIPEEPDAGPMAISPSVETIAPMQVIAGDPIAVTCTLTEGTVDEPITTMVQGELVVMDEASVTRTGTGLVARTVGTVQIACRLPDRDLVDETPASVEILVGQAANIVTEMAPSPVTAGGTVTATCTVYDSQANIITDAQPTLELSPTDGGNTITDLTAEMTRAGNYVGRCVLPGTTTNNAPFAVIPDLPANIAIAKSPDLPVYAVNDIITITHIVTDRFDNEIPLAMVDKESTALTGVGPTVPMPPEQFQYRGEGTYRVDAEVTEPTFEGTAVTASVVLTVNSLGPAIVCGSPADGTMVNHTPGTNRTFTGTANDVSGVTSVRVNNTLATLNGSGGFSLSIPTRFGINFVKVEAFDTFNVPTTKYCSFLVANQWGSTTSTTSDVVSLRMTETAVDDGNRSNALGSFGDILHTVLNSQGLRDALHNALLAANPLKPSSCDQQVCVFGLCTCVLRSAINYQSSSLDGAKTVSMSLVQNGLSITARLENLNVRLRVNGHAAGINFDTSGNVNIASVQIGMILDPSISGGAPRVTVRANSTSVAVGAIDTNFSGIDGFIINIAVSIANGAVRDLVATTLRNYVQQNFDSVLDGVLGGLDISTLGATFNVPRLAGGGSVPLSFGVAFSSISTTATRMLFGIGTRMSATIANAFPTLGVPIQPGAVLLDPTSNTNTAVAVHVALMNQALHALWKANYLRVTIPGSAIGLPSTVSIALTGRLPPVVTLTATNRAELSLGAVDATIQYPGLPPNTAVTFGARAHTTVSLSGNDLVFGGFVLDEVRVSSDLFTFDAAELMTIEDALADVAQNIITQSLNNAIPAIPIPAFEIPSSLGTFGLPVGEELGIVNPALQSSGQHFVLRGSFGLR